MITTSRVWLTDDVELCCIHNMHVPPWPLLSSQAHSTHPRAMLHRMCQQWLEMLRWPWEHVRRCTSPTALYHGDPPAGATCTEGVTPTSPGGWLGGHVAGDAVKGQQQQQQQQQQEEGSAHAGDECVPVAAVVGQPIDSPPRCRCGCELPVSTGRAVWEAIPPAHRSSMILETCQYLVASGSGHGCWLSEDTGTSTSL